MNYLMDLSISHDLNCKNDMVIVSSKSGIALHEEVYKIAKYFKQELDYDTVPYSSLGILPNKNEAILFTCLAYDCIVEQRTPRRIYGACCFSKLNFTTFKSCWELEWIWIHPFFRNRGNLKNNWVHLENKFGNFNIKSPVSNDMNAFLNKIDSQHRIM